VEVIILGVEGAVASKIVTSQDATIWVIVDACGLEFSLLVVVTEAAG